MRSYCIEGNFAPKEISMLRKPRDAKAGGTRELGGEEKKIPGEKKASPCLQGGIRGMHP